MPFTVGNLPRSPQHFNVTAAVVAFMHSNRSWNHRSECLLNEARSSAAMNQAGTGGVQGETSPRGTFPMSK